jgi:hypothetical protein
MSGAKKATVTIINFNFFEKVMPKRKVVKNEVAEILLTEKILSGSTWVTPKV